MKSKWMKEWKKRRGKKGKESENKGKRENKGGERGKVKGEFVREEEERRKKVCLRGNTC